MEALKTGNSLVTFAEGTRSPDGRLQSMKAGPIKMAVKAGVKVLFLRLHTLVASGLIH